MFSKNVTKIDTLRYRYRTYLPSSLYSPSRLVEFQLLLRKRRGWLPPRRRSRSTPMTASYMSRSAHKSTLNIVGDAKSTVTVRACNHSTWDVTSQTVPLIKSAVGHLHCLRRPQSWHACAISLNPKQNASKRARLSLTLVKLQRCKRLRSANKICWSWKLSASLPFHR